jgi:purine-binding chemotaxis protein CheW
MSGVHVRVLVAGEHYGLAVERVLEVAELGNIAAVPGSPPYVMGVHNLHGQVVPVIALATRLGLAEAEPPQRIVVTELGELKAGLAVDAVIDVGELPETSEQVESPYLRGAVLVDGVLVGLLDVEAVLAPISTSGTPA